MPARVFWNILLSCKCLIVAKNMYSILFTKYSVFMIGHFDFEPYSAGSFDCSCMYHASSMQIQRG